jgi:hypothetical protein
MAKATILGKDRCSFDKGANTAISTDRTGANAMTREQRSERPTHAGLVWLVLSVAIVVGVIVSKERVATPPVGAASLAR